MTTHIEQQPASGQPGVAQWMNKPEVMGCPPGLEYLTQVDQLLVHQTVELLEAFTGIETKNRFQVKNSVGQQIYYAAEESGFCTRQLCGAHRGFQMHVVDNLGNEVIRAEREFKCCAGCCWCANADCGAYELTVEAPVGNVIGYVRQQRSFWKANLHILDAQRQPVLQIQQEQCCICECPCFDVVYKLLSMDGTEVGKLSKQWTGFVKEMFTDADNFGIQFPMDLDVKVKATLVGAVFLCNMMFFENNGGGGGGG